MPSWATGGGLSIGRHTFYAPDAGGMGGESHATLGNILLVRGFAAAELTLAKLKTATVR